MSDALNADQIAYLATQHLGRLATVDKRGAPQNSPVGFRYNADGGTVDIGGYHLGDTRKFHNVETHGEVSLVVDDVVATDPWTVRMVEIRGTAEALRDVEPLRTGMSREIIRIHPRRVIDYGLS
ncbi:PPOX class F420-dependent oxidoreductase [Antrihabitans cavernicola]|uniref:PPOX class F420-dependent oxidoreductase n=1 Tax=Antrihabitans cavernicola TaxID=2495913 RepID=A0A5A7SEF5_9NOCA|nr:PPOX class F420-dependent oxidoreductase [Spelaeibacter cavernicola]KAA0022601.1 PPOX class F420-dependent oxidoreductase [Spelaeibacter cavernicola]